ncbi:MAG: NosD domain-containing protein [Promethearchaeia archaeon]
MNSKRQPITLILCVIVVFLFFGGSFLIVSGIHSEERYLNRGSNDNNGINKSPRISGYDNNIFIDGNDDFAEQAEQNDWDGDGTENNPYIIRDLEINGMESNGITIQNTDAYFIIENVKVKDGSSENNVGFNLENVKNGELRNNTAQNNLHGFELSDSFKIKLTGNFVNESDGLFSAGFLLVSSNEIELTGNTANDNENGFELKKSHNNTLTENIAKDNSFILKESHNNTLKGNTADNCYNGFELKESHNNTLTENIAKDNFQYGIYLERSNYNIIKANILDQNMMGCIEEEKCEGNNISNNTCEERWIFLFRNEVSLFLIGIVILIFICCGLSIVANAKKKKEKSKYQQRSTLPSPPASNSQQKNPQTPQEFTSSSPKRATNNWDAEEIKPSFLKKHYILVVFIFILFLAFVMLGYCYQEYGSVKVSEINSYNDPAVNLYFLLVFITAFGAIPFLILDIVVSRQVKKKYRKRFKQLHQKNPYRQGYQTQHPTQRKQKEKQGQSKKEPNIISQQLKNPLTRPYVPFFILSMVLIAVVVVFVEGFKIPLLWQAILILSILSIPGFFLISTGNVMLFRNFLNNLKDKHFVTIRKLIYYIFIFMGAAITFLIAFLIGFVYIWIAFWVFTFIVVISEMNKAFMKNLEFIPEGKKWSIFLWFMAFLPLTGYIGYKIIYQLISGADLLTAILANGTAFVVGVIGVAMIWGLSFFLIVITKKEEQEKARCVAAFTISFGILLASWVITAAESFTPTQKLALNSLNLYIAFKAVIKKVKDNLTGFQDEYQDNFSFSSRIISKFIGKKGEKSREAVIFMVYSSLFFGYLISVVVLSFLTNSINETASFLGIDFQAPSLGKIIVYAIQIGIAITIVIPYLSIKYLTFDLEKYNQLKDKYNEPGKIAKVVNFLKKIFNFFRRKKTAETEQEDVQQVEESTPTEQTQPEEELTLPSLEPQEGFQKSSQKNQFIDSESPVKEQGEKIQFVSKNASERTENLVSEESEHKEIKHKESKKLVESPMTEGGQKGSSKKFQKKELETKVIETERSDIINEEPLARHPKESRSRKEKSEVTKPVQEKNKKRLTEIVKYIYNLPKIYTEITFSKLSSKTGLKTGTLEDLIEEMIISGEIEAKIKKETIIFQKENQKSEKVIEEEVSPRGEGRIKFKDEVLDTKNDDEERKEPQEDLADRKEGKRKEKRKKEKIRQKDEFERTKSIDEEVAAEKYSEGNGLISKNEPNMESIFSFQNSPKIKDDSKASHNLKPKVSSEIESKEKTDIEEIDAEQLKASIKKSALKGGVNAENAEGKSRTPQKGDETVRCIVCDAENQISNKTCRVCGTDLDYKRTKRIYCKKCGKKNYSRAKYCKNCGSLLKE